MYYSINKAVKVKGGWDIYLKKSDLSLIKSTGVNGIIGILSALITGVGGAVIGVIASSIVHYGIRPKRRNDIQNKN